MKQPTLYLDAMQWQATDVQGQWLTGRRGHSVELPLDQPSVWLETLGARRRSISVVLSAACVPGLSLPWSASVPLASDVRRRVHEAWLLRGVTASSHDIRIHWPDYGMPLVSLAYPTALLRGLAAQLAPHRLGSVECGVFAAADRHLAGSRAARELLLVAERDGYSALHIEAGQLTGAERLRPDGLGLDALPVWLKRKAMEYPGNGEIQWLAGDTPDAPSMREVLA